MYSENISTSDNKISKIKHLINFEYTYFHSKDFSFDNFTNYLDYFKNHNYEKDFDCFRFNAVTNKSVKLFETSSTAEFYGVTLKNFYIEDISKNEYYNYSFFEPFYRVFIGDNYLKLFEKLQPLLLKKDNFYYIEILKESIETKLPEPWNRCKEPSSDKPFHQMNCIEACIYKEIKSEYNCTFVTTLFSIHGLGECTGSMSFYKKLFLEDCQKQCFSENSCFSEKLTWRVDTSDQVEDFTAFLFSFGEFSTLNITQIPKIDGFTFINNIGGGLGLFMGIAFPTLIEFIQFCFEIFLILFVQKID